MLILVIFIYINQTSAPAWIKSFWFSLWVGNALFYFLDWLINLLILLFIAWYTRSFAAFLKILNKATYHWSRIWILNQIQIFNSQNWNNIIKILMWLWSFSINILLILNYLSFLNFYNFIFSYLLIFSYFILLTFIVPNIFTLMKLIIFLNFNILVSI